MRRCGVLVGGQAGMLAGSDGVLFGMLILLAGSLAILNVWAVIDTRAALDAAAREYLRTYTEQSSADAAATAGELAARRLLDERGTLGTGSPRTARPRPALCQLGRFLRHPQG